MLFKTSRSLDFWYFLSLTSKLQKQTQFQDVSCDGGGWLKDRFKLFRQQCWTFVFQQLSVTLVRQSSPPQVCAGSVAQDELHDGVCGCKSCAADVTSLLACGAMSVGPSVAQQFPMFRKIAVISFSRSRNPKFFFDCLMMKMKTLGEPHAQRRSVAFQKTRNVRIVTNVRNPWKLKFTHRMYKISVLDL